MICSNCKQEGAHYVPPSFNETGFYICGRPTPSALSREQVEEYTSRFYNCGFLYLKKVFNDHDAAQRATIEQQAQEMAHYRAACASVGETIERLTGDVKDQKAKQAACVAELAARTKDMDWYKRAYQELVNGLADTASLRNTIAQLQATLTAREAEIERLKNDPDYQQCCELRERARQDAARLREALEAHMQLAAKICYAEPELSQYRAMTEQAQRALKEGV